MRHKKRGRKLGRKRNQRRALLRSLAVSLIQREKIKTTEAKAKELRPFIEKIITRAKTNSVANRRMVVAKIGAKSAKKAFEKIGPRYEKRRGGYTRIMKLPFRRGDAAKMAIIEFVESRK